MDLADELCAAVSALENDLTVMKGLTFRPMTNWRATYTTGQARSVGYPLAPP
jgi:hypothetical protein